MFNMHRDYRSAKLNRDRGFTLIELLTTVAIIGIIASIGWSYYDSQKLRGYRNKAVIALTTLAQLEERYMTENGTYSSSISSLSPPATVVSSNGTTPRGAYKVSVTFPTGTGCKVSVPNGVPQTRYYCYQIHATATGNQAKDTACTDFYLDQTGKRWSEGISNGSKQINTGNSAVCWSK